jgi:type I restriction enzyme R subunit
MLANFDDLSLVELLVEKGKDVLKDVPDSIKNNPDAMQKPLKTI